MLKSEKTILHNGDHVNVSCRGVGAGDFKLEDAVADDYLDVKSYCLIYQKIGGLDEVEEYCTTSLSVCEVILYYFCEFYGVIFGFVMLTEPKLDVLDAPLFKLFN